MCITVCELHDCVHNWRAGEEGGGGCYSSSFSCIRATRFAVAGQKPTNAGPSSKEKKTVAAIAPAASGRLVVLAPEWGCKARAACVFAEVSECELERGGVGCGGMPGRQATGQRLTAEEGG